MRTIRRSNSRVNSGADVPALVARLKRKGVRLRALTRGTIEVTNPTRLTPKDHAAIDDNHAEIVRYLKETQATNQDRFASRPSLKHLKKPAAPQARESRAAFNPAPKSRHLFELD
jgi:hypothetical protein